MHSYDKRSDLIAALRDLAEVAADAVSENVLASRLVGLGRKLSGFPAGAMLMRFGTERVRIPCNQGVDPTYLKFVADRYADLPGMVTLGTGEPMLVPDAATDPRYGAIRERLAAANIGAIAVFPLYDAAEELIGALLLYHDRPAAIDPVAAGLVQAACRHVALTVANERLRQAREELWRQSLSERSHDIIAVLASGVAHDLNNVLGAILGLLQLLPRLEADEVTTYATRLEKQVKEAAELTRSIVELGRRSHTESPETCELVTATHEMADLLGAGLPPGTTLDVDAPSEEIWASISPVSFSRVLLNLLLNASQAVQQRDEGRIVIRVAPDATGCLVIVEDDGPGVPADRREAIFEPFRSFSKGGSGVGLAASRGLVVRHGGTLTVGDRDGGGARFELHLRPARAATAPIAPPETPSPAAEEQRGRVLIAEDEPIQRDMYADALREAGFVVDAVADGEAARAALAGRHGHYVAAVLDQIMPKYLGTKLLDELRQGGGTLPVLMVTGYGWDPQVRAIALDDWTRVVSKPLSGPQVVEALRALLAAVAETGSPAEP